MATKKPTSQADAETAKSAARSRLAAGKKVPAVTRLPTAEARRKDVVAARSQRASVPSGLHAHEQLIFKVQVSIGPGASLTLAYDEHQKHVLHIPTPPQLLRLLNGRPKAYFRGRVVNQVLKLETMLTDEEAQEIGW